MCEGIPDQFKDVLPEGDLSYFIRKVDRPSHWIGAEDTDEPADPEFVAEIMGNVFRGSSAEPISVYMAQTPKDLVRIALGLNSGRCGSLREKLDLLLIPENEVTQSGLTPHPSLGETKCSHANRQHFDIPYDHAALARLVSRLVESGHRLTRLNRSAMRAAIEHAQAISCKVLPSDDRPCECEAPGVDRP